MWQQINFQIKSRIFSTTSAAHSSFGWSAKYQSRNHTCASTRENLILLHANNKGADQPAHPRSLVSAFVIRDLEILLVNTASYKKQYSSKIKSETSLQKKTFELR